MNKTRQKAKHLVTRVHAKHRALTGEHWFNVVIAGTLFTTGHGIEALAGGMAALFGTVAIVVEFIGEES